MRVLLVWAIAAALLSAGCALAPRTPIATAEDFRARVVDRPLEGGEGWNRLVIQSDGTMTGLRADGATLSGSWTFENGYFCREAIVDGASLGTDCQTVSIDGDSAVFHRDGGRGERISYTFK
ncbi:MAG: hypothetical protein HKM95_18240 [Inquilinus sp.]|nr:hypothetical protein [Inquilinus sp.]